MGWKSKFVLLLIVYFAGFATAVYNFAPVPGKDSRISKPSQKSFAVSDAKTDELVKSFNVQMHKCFDWSKEAAVRTGKFMKQKFDERQHSKASKDKTELKTSS